MNLYRVTVERDNNGGVAVMTEKVNLMVKEVPETKTYLQDGPWKTKTIHYFEKGGDAYLFGGEVLMQAMREDGEDI